MRRSIVLVLPLVLLAAATSLTAVAGAQLVTGHGQAPLVDSYANSSNYLTIPADDVEGTDTATVGLDAGLAVGIDGRDLQTAHRVASFRQRFDAATTETDRTAAYDAVIAAIEDRATALRERNEGITEAYADGSISTATLLRERAVIVAEASRLQGTVSELRAVESETLGFEMSSTQRSRLREASGQLSIVRGPVGERVAGLASDGGGPQAVYVENSSDGHVLALVDGDTYVREAYLGDERDPGAANRFVAENGTVLLEQVRQRALGLYSHTDSVSVEPVGDVYQFNGVSRDGQVTAYLDGGSGEVFAERQRLNASNLAVGQTHATSNDSLGLRVNTTFATGPMEVTLVDDTGAPIDGTVSLDGERLGQTGADGSLWTIEPRDGTQVTATTADGNLTVSVPGA